MKTKKPITRISLHYSTKDVQHWVSVARWSGGGFESFDYHLYMVSVSQYMRWHRVLLDSNKLRRRDMRVLNEGLHKPSLYKIPFDVV